MLKIKADRMAELEPCEYCKSLVPKTLYIAEAVEPRIFFDISGSTIRFYDEEYPGYVDSFYINYCPMCGRWLKAEREEE